ncbi:MAG: hypothetical protein ACREQF_12645 [Candidatus Binataceae bacterium]
MSAQTRRAAGENFTYRRLGQHAVKGASQPVEIFELLDAAAARPRRVAERLRMLLTRVAFQETCLTVGASLGLVAAFYLLTLIRPPTEPTPEEVAREMGFAAAVSQVNGEKDPRVEAALYTALENCRRRNDEACELGPMAGLRVMHTLRGEFDEAEQCARRMLEIAARRGNRTWLAGAHCHMGNALDARGAVVEAIKHYDQGLAIAEQAPVKFLDMYEDPRPTCTALSAMPLVRAGYIDQARRRVARSLELAHGSDDQYTLALSIHICILAYVHLYDPASATPAAEMEEESRWLDEGLALADHRGYAKIGHELKRLRAAGWYFSGDPERGIKGLRALGESFEAAVDEGFYRGGKYIYPALKYLEPFDTNSDLMRLRGELWLRAVPPREREAEECLRRAIAIAEGYGEKFLQLQAAFKLSQLLTRQGKLEEARDALHPIYSWFTEGFDTPWMVRAKKLLDELDVKIAARNVSHADPHVSKKDGGLAVS